MKPRLLAGDRFSVAGFVLAWSLLWWAIRALSLPNLDGYGDMLENAAWGQVFEWGTHKHPPLQAWAAGAWFSVWPHTAWAYWLLAGLNAAVALAGIAALARQDVALQGAAADWTIPPDSSGLNGPTGSAEATPRVRVAVLLAGLALPYTTLAGKLNANSVLLAVWPWLVWMMLRSVQSAARPAARTTNGLNAIGLGLLAALAMLGKYYSGVLLLALALAALVAPAGRRWYATRWPWMALGVCVAALAPHAAWLAHHEGLSLRYIDQQGDGQVGWFNTLKFALGPLMYWIIPVLGVAWALARRRTTPQVGRLGAWARMWRGPRDILSSASFLVWALTLGFGLSGFVELSLPWAIPIGFAYTVLLVRLLDDAQIAACVAGLRRHGVKAALALLGLAAVATAVQSFRPSGGFDLPRQAAARGLMAAWQQQHPGEPLLWVAGEWPEIGLLAFYGDSRVRVLPDWPDTPVALTLSTRGEFAGRWGLWLCTDGLPLSEPPTPCQQRAQEIARQTGQALQTLTVRASGWPWWHAREHSYRYVAVPPGTVAPAENAPDHAPDHALNTP